MYLVFANETDLDTANATLGQSYKFQINDGRWITPNPGLAGETLPTYTEEAELLSWYPEDSRQYYYLKKTIDDGLNAKFDAIDIACELVKREFTCENIRMGITSMMYDSNTRMTQFVLNSMEKVDYCMRSRSTDAVFDLIDEVPRETIFLTEARMTAFKARLYEELSKI